MTLFQNFKDFVSSENISERFAALEKLAKESSSWQGKLLTWQIMALIPTNAEQAKLASSISLPELPGSEWAILSYLLQKESNEDVLSSCIYTVAKYKRLSLGYRIERLFENKIISNNILSSILTYIGETGDERFAKHLITYFSINLTEHSLAKGFHAFLKLGIIDQNAINIAFNILNSETSPNLERTSVLSAIFYLAFACDKSQILKLKAFYSICLNKELIRLLETILMKIDTILGKPNETEAAAYFLETALTEKSTNFIGYGLISPIALERETQSVLLKFGFKFPHEITNIILSLKNKCCINILSYDSHIGISSIENKNNHSLAKLWLQNIPFQNERFLDSVKNPEHFYLWHKDHCDISFIFLEATLFNSSAKNSWQNFFERTLEGQILLAQIFAFEKISILKSAQQIESFIYQNINKTLSFLKKEKKITYDEFVEQIYSICIGSEISSHFMQEIYNKIPFSGTSWVFTAIALSAPKLEVHTLSVAIQRELEIIKQTLLNGNMDKNEYILEVTSRFQSILVGTDRFKVQVNQPILNSLRDISTFIQNVLDNVDTKEENQEEIDDEHADWKGHSITDRPILRWNAILQVCLNTNLTLEEKEYYEKLLREGLRVAPHFEKRWIVRALVKLDTDDSIKTVLYSTLQHIDANFVEHSISELLSSKHPRAQQALIQCISKYNISNETKMRIINEISLDKPDEILKELKNLQLLKLSEEINKALNEAIIKISQLTPLIPNKFSENDIKISSVDIDSIIKNFLPNTDELSVDTKSALRTAEMIFIQSKEWGNDAVDLSPIVNMHCKAVELILRDTFEAVTDSIIRKGELSQKLINMGYGKTNTEKMVIFEDYMASLPIIKTIPYFSKFKLRKMLKAICLYRPGKRFTLDGPKAFALFLLVTARKQCQFHFENSLPLSFKNDTELFEFIKLVHSLQDSRNRAVHEGLTWEARSEIETMREQAYKIIAKCSELGKNFKT